MRHKLFLLENEVPRCAVCGKPATCYGKYEGWNESSCACNACCAHGNEDGDCKPIEIFFCCRIRKCGWRGQEHELFPVTKRRNPGVMYQVCPKCGEDEFYVRPLKDCLPALNAGKTPNVTPAASKV